MAERGSDASTTLISAKRFALHRRTRHMTNGDGPAFPIHPSRLDRKQ
jgi:hypothetical protein